MTLKSLIVRLTHMSLTRRVTPRLAVARWVLEARLCAQDIDVYSFTLTTNSDVEALYTFERTLITLEVRSARRVGARDRSQHPDLYRREAQRDIARAQVNIFSVRGSIPGSLEYSFSLERN